MEPTNNYKMFKNYIHNELGITKDDIKKWTEDAVIKTVDKKIDVFINSNRFEKLLLNRITSIIDTENIYDSFYNPKTFKNWFLGMIKYEIKSKIIDNINFNIDFNIKNNE